MQVPVWLPESVNHSRATDSLKIKYTLKAMYEPVELAETDLEIHVLNASRVTCR
jgi:hypothetical protein